MCMSLEVILNHILVIKPLSYSFLRTIVSCNKLGICEVDHCPANEDNYWNLFYMSIVTLSNIRIYCSKLKKYCLEHPPFLLIEYDIVHSCVRST